MGQRLMQYLKRAKLLEADLEAELAVQQDAPLTLVLALNADSMGTWFFPALSEVLIRERVLLDLTVEDQDHTYLAGDGHGHRLHQHGSETHARLHGRAAGRDALLAGGHARVPPAMVPTA
jgi:hypothetical protein